MDPVVLTALMFGLLSAVSLPLGAALGVSWRPPDRVVAVMLAFGGGALLAALTLDLVAPGIDRGHFVDLAVGAVIGGLLFKGLDRAVNRRGGYLRKPSTALQHWRTRSATRLTRVLRNLERTQPLGDIDTQVREALLHLIEVHTIPAGTWLWRRGDPPDHLFVIESGTVELSDPERGGEIFERLTTNAAFGRMSFVTGMARATEARASTRCVLLGIPRDRLLEAMADTPGLRRVLLRLVDATEVLTYLEQRQGVSAGDARAWRAQAVREILDQGTYQGADTRTASTAQLTELLRAESRLQFFTGLPPRLLEKFAERMFRVTLPEGYAVFHSGQLADRMVLMETGTASSFAGDERRSGARPIHPGEAAGGLALLTHGVHTTTVVTTSECTVHVLRRQDLDQLLVDEPELRAHVAALLRSPDVQSYLRESQSLDEGEAHGWTTKATRDATLGRGVPSLAALTQPSSVPQGAAMAMFLGILLDGIPESFVIGANVLNTGGLSWSLLAGLFLANFPEALSSAVGMRDQGMRRARILAMWTSLMVITGLGAAFGALLLNGASGSVFALIEGIAAGAMLTMIAETMLPEAYHKGGGVVGLSTLGGFLAAIAANHVG